MTTDFFLQNPDDAVTILRLKVDTIPVVYSVSVPLPNRVTLVALAPGELPIEKVIRNSEWSY